MEVIEKLVGERRLQNMIFRTHHICPGYDCNPSAVISVQIEPKLNSCIKKPVLMVIIFTLKFVHEHSFSKHLHFQYYC